jgi:hypothetical protein
MPDIRPTTQVLQAPRLTQAHLTVRWNRYGIQVWDGGSFMAGFTRERLQQGPEAAKEAVHCLLTSLGYAVTVERDL